jgi:hypothetical protein
MQLHYNLKIHRKKALGAQHLAFETWKRKLQNQALFALRVGFSAR